MQTSIFIAAPPDNAFSASRMNTRTAARRNGSARRHGSYSLNAISIRFRSPLSNDRSAGMKRSAARLIEGRSRHDCLRAGQNGPHSL
jgi:hypothetical protein